MGNIRYEWKFSLETHLMVDFPLPCLILEGMLKSYSKQVLDVQRSS